MSNDYLQLLRDNSDFRKLYLARLISFGGDWFLTVPLLGLVYELSGSAFATAAALAVQALPTFFFAPIAGIAADRFDRKKILVITDVSQALIVATLLFAEQRGGIALVMSVMALQGIGQAFFFPASSSGLPNIVSDKQLGPANVLLGSAWGSMAAVGAALGGVIASLVSREAAFLIDSTSFLVAAALAASIRGSLQEARRAPRFGFVESMREALAYARTHKAVAALLTSKGGFALWASAAIAMYPILSFDVFDLGDAGTGILYGARGVGALIGPFLAFRLAAGDDRRIYRTIGWSIALWGAMYVVLGSTDLIVTAAIAVAVAHMGGGTQWAFSSYGLQNLTPDAVRGRIFAFDFGALRLMTALSSLLGGFLAEIVSAQAVVALMGVLGMLLGIGWSRVTAPIWSALRIET